MLELLKELRSLKPTEVYEVCDVLRKYDFYISDNIVYSQPTEHVRLGYNHAKEMWFVETKTKSLYHVHEVEEYTTEVNAVSLAVILMNKCNLMH